MIKILIKTIIISAISFSIIFFFIRSIKHDNIHGKIIYDKGIALPSDAIAIVQIIHSIGNIQKIIAQIQSKPTASIHFSFPITIDQLNNNKSYFLQAKIVVGDEIWFFHEEPIRVDTNRSGYMIHLNPVETLDNQENLITGHHWIAENIVNHQVLDNTDITLFIAQESNNVKNYKVSGSDGCNHYFTTALFNGKDNLVFKRPATTFKLCPDTIALQAAEFITMMQKVKKYQIKKTTLYFLDENFHYLAKFKTN
ncbi:MAG: putative heat shock protein [Candidatus Tokpelaia sp. JSC161]|jgi:heat shock protein HslJ|nr:MAG: putative heat shock protein [Candidatus Tokpelaia sp. JSC161]